MFSSRKPPDTIPGHQHGWKPVTLSATVLSLFALISIILGIIIEFLAQWAQRSGGLATVPSSEDFPTYVSFSYRFLPTILAVFYSLFWSWVDLDAKRMQPWFELSKPGGATAENSIFLSYPYDFVAFVPATALRRRLVGQPRSCLITYLKNTAGIGRPSAPASPWSSFSG